MKRNLLFYSLIFLLSSAVFGMNACNSTVCPEPGKGAPPTHITGSELESLIATGDVIVINARPGASTGLPTTISLSVNSAAEEVAAIIPSKNALVVTYCGSINCHLSGILARHLRSLGYTNVREYPSGVRGWKKSGRPLVAI